MAYLAREIKDRVSIGDDLFRIVDIGDGRHRLIPAPEVVSEVGTSVNKELLQLIEDRVVWLMNSVFSDITDNPYAITFESLDGLTVSGVWNASQGRIEC